MRTNQRFPAPRRNAPPPPPSRPNAATRPAEIRVRLYHWPATPGSAFGVVYVIASAAERDALIARLSEKTGAQAVALPDGDFPLGEVRNPMVRESWAASARRGGACLAL